jgi:hypothetical protein
VYVYVSICVCMYVCMYVWVVIVAVAETPFGKLALHLWLCVCMYVCMYVCSRMHKTIALVYRIHTATGMRVCLSSCVPLACVCACVCVHAQDLTIALLYR